MLLELLILGIANSALSSKKPHSSKCDHYKIERAKQKALEERRKAEFERERKSKERLREADRAWQRELSIAVHEDIERKRKYK